MEGECRAGWGKKVQSPPAGGVCREGENRACLSHAKLDNLKTRGGDLYLESEKINRALLGARLESSPGKSMDRY